MDGGGLQPEYPLMEMKTWELLIGNDKPGKMGNDNT